MEISGKVIAVLPLKEGASWKAQDFIIETKGQYPKKVCLNLFGDKVALMPNVGDEVTASIEIESREYNDKWFTTVRVWKIAITQTAQIQNQTASGPVGGVNSDTDLPF